MQALQEVRQKLKANSEIIRETVTAAPEEAHVEPEKALREAHEKITSLTREGNSLALLAPPTGLRRAKRAPPNLAAAHPLGTSPGVPPRVPALPLAASKAPAPLLSVVEDSALARSAGPKGTRAAAPHASHRVKVELVAGEAGVSVSLTPASGAPLTPGPVPLLSVVDDTAVAHASRDSATKTRARAHGEAEGEPGGRHYPFVEGGPGLTAAGLYSLPNADGTTGAVGTATFLHAAHRRSAPGPHPDAEIRAPAGAGSAGPVPPNADGAPRGQAPDPATLQSALHSAGLAGPAADAPVGASANTVDGSGFGALPRGEGASHVALLEPVNGPRNSASSLGRGGSADDGEEREGELERREGEFELDNNVRRVPLSHPNPQNTEVFDAAHAGTGLESGHVEPRDAVSVPPEVRQAVGGESGVGVGAGETAKEGRAGDAGGLAGDNVDGNDVHALASFGSSGQDLATSAGEKRSRTDAADAALLAFAPASKKPADGGSVRSPVPLSAPQTQAYFFTQASATRPLQRPLGNSPHLLNLQQIGGNSPGQGRDAGAMLQQQQGAAIPLGDQQYSVSWDVTRDAAPTWAGSGAGIPQQASIASLVQHNAFAVYTKAVGQNGPATQAVGGLASPWQEPAPRGNQLVASLQSFQDSAGTMRNQSSNVLSRSPPIHAAHGEGTFAGSAASGAPWASPRSRGSLRGYPAGHATSRSPGRAGPALGAPAPCQGAGGVGIPASPGVPVAGTVPGLAGSALSAPAYEALVSLLGGHATSPHVAPPAAGLASPVGTLQRLVDHGGRSLPAMNQLLAMLPGTLHNHVVTSYAQSLLQGGPDALLLQAQVLLASDRPSALNCRALWNEVIMELL